MDERPVAKVLQFPAPKPDIKAATCGCGGQTFILVCDAKEVPDFVYCTTCEHRQSLITWDWASPPSAAGDEHG